ncbi:uncharacterized protein LOC127377325 isoform X1 [Dicentrarchus labrax]|uniref:C1q domain-containing protein n=1 Tax=Dicentrarchus labrax TaxID=13489 RepID=A0A8P4K0B5_DICLA|nr:uncharacterized protein LOC127377325 isoform X1 [Dicentrarchus labrax]
MKTSLVFLVLILCYLCRARKHSSDNDILLQAVEGGEEKAQTQRPGTEAEGGEPELVLQSDIWAELRILRDIVKEQRLEIWHLTNRVTAAESLVDELQKANTVMEARMTAAESLTDELQMENDAQATELTVTQQKLSSLQQRLTVSEDRVEELRKQQEGQEATVQELQNTNRVRKLAFSVSFRASGEGNTSNEDFLPLIYRNVFTNIGNHYNPHTGFFTAPLRGVYYFRFTGHVAHADLSMRLRLFKNGDAIVMAGDQHTTTTDPEDNASNGVVLQLDVGDVVSVQLSGDVWDDHYCRTTFSGFLLFPL